MLSIRTLRIVFMFVVALTYPELSSAQSKISVSVYDELKSSDVVRVIVTLRPNPNVEGGGTSLSNPTGYLSEALGADVSHVTPVGRWPIVAAEITGEALRRLNEDPNIAMVVRDVPVPSILFDSVPLVGADKFHAKGIDGATNSVAVLDTGIQSDHPAFAASIVAEACFSTAESTAYAVRSLCSNGLSVDLTAGAAGGCPSTLAGCYHGTHVAGIVAGHDMDDGSHHFGGVAPGAHLVPVTVFTQFDDADVCNPAPSPCILSFTSDQLRALDWVYKHRDEFAVAAINMSLGGGYYNQFCDTDNALTEIIERLRSEGVITVIAAGNEAFYDGVSSPACISSAFTVAALNKSGQLDVRYSNVSANVDIAAPGTAIVSANLGSGLFTASGTSMAAPHVAAMIALLREAYPDASALQLETMLRDSGKSVKDPRTDGVVAQAFLREEAIPDGSATVPASFDQPSISLPTTQFIIRTEQSVPDIEQMLAQCIGCSNIRSIGGGNLVVQVDPNQFTANGSGASVRSKLEELLGNNGTVFEDSIVPALGNIRF